MIQNVSFERPGRVRVRTSRERSELLAHQIKFLYTLIVFTCSLRISRSFPLQTEDERKATKREHNKKCQEKRQEKRKEKKDTKNGEEDNTDKSKEKPLVEIEISSSSDEDDDEQESAKRPCK